MFTKRDHVIEYYVTLKLCLMELIILTAARLENKNVCQQYKTTAPKIKLLIVY